MDFIHCTSLLDTVVIEHTYKQKLTKQCIVNIQHQKQLIRTWFIQYLKVVRFYSLLNLCQILLPASKLMLQHTYLTLCPMQTADHHCQTHIEQLPCPLPLANCLINCHLTYCLIRPSIIIIIITRLVTRHMSA